MGKMFNKFKNRYKEVIMLYDDLYFSRLTKNSSIDCRPLPIEKGKVGVDFVGTYEGDNVTFYYLVDALPKELYINFKTKIRRECRAGVKVNFLTYIRGHDIDWNSAQMNSRLRVLRSVSDDNNKADIDAYNLHDNVGSLSKQEHIEESLKYLALADKGRRRSLLKTTIMITVTGKRGEDFDETARAIENYARGIEIQLRRVLYNIPDILRFFSPFNHSSSKGIRESLPTMVLTDEIVARFSTFTQGTLGERGVYFGTDIYSKFPILKEVKPRVDTAENWLIVGETGSGKSYSIKDIVLQLLSLNFNGTFMDIEGFEYIPIGKFMSSESKVIVINMAEGSGNYFDPVEVFDLIGIEEIDKEALNMSVNFTLTTLRTLIGVEYDRDTWMEVVVNDAVGETYRTAGIVNSDRTTWTKSKGLTLFDVYDKLFELKDEKFRTDEGYLQALSKAIALTGRYFEADGTRSEVFKTRVAVHDVITAKIVICSFGMAGKSPDSVDATQLALMQLGAAQLSFQRSVFSKARGLFNFKVWEEFQRWGKFPNSENTIGVAVTGGRKLGDVNIIVTNDVAQILRDDKFGIISNLTSYMIGAVMDRDVRHELAKRLSIPHMTDELDKISRAAKLTESSRNKKRKATGERTSESVYTYSFLCGLDKDKFGVTKFLNPRDIEDSAIFKTGVDLKIGVEKEEEELQFN